MQTIYPLNQISNEERRRRLLADGERMTFNAMMMDSRSPAATNAVRDAHAALCAVTGRTPMRGHDVSATAAQIARDAETRREVNEAAVLAHVCVDSERRGAVVPTTDRRLLDAGKAAAEAARAARYS